MKSNAPTHAGAVYMLLAELWPKNGYAILPEVGNATGARTKRHADAVLIGRYAMLATASETMMQQWREGA